MTLKLSQPTITKIPILHKPVMITKIPILHKPVVMKQSHWNFFPHPFSETSSFKFLKKGA